MGPFLGQVNKPPSNGIIMNIIELFPNIRPKIHGKDTGFFFPEAEFGFAGCFVIKSIRFNFV
jgi:hypothetical protein